MSHNRAIFFDIDDTLIATKSMFEFQRYYFTHAAEHRREDPELLMEQFRVSLNAAVPDGSRAALNTAFYHSFVGRSPMEVEELAEAWAETLDQTLWIKSACVLLEAYRQRGYLIVGVSGSSHEILSGIARRLRLDHLLAANLDIQFGLYTGELLPPQTIGAGKGIAIRQLANTLKIDLMECAACGDHITDLSMLELVGKQYVVSGDPELEAIGRRNCWTILPRSDSSASVQAKQEVHV